MIFNRKKPLLHVAAEKLGFSDQEYLHVLIEYAGFLLSADPQFTDEAFKRLSSSRGRALPEHYEAHEDALRGKTSHDDQCGKRVH